MKANTLLLIIMCICLSTAAQTKKEQILNLNSQMDSLKTTVNNLKSIITSKEVIINSLNEQISEYDLEIYSYKNKIIEKDLLIKDLENQILFNKTRIDLLNKRIIDLSNNIDSNNNQNSDSNFSNQDGTTIKINLHNYEGKYKVPETEFFGEGELIFTVVDSRLEGNCELTVYPMRGLAKIKYIINSLNGQGVGMYKNSYQVYSRWGELLQENKQSSEGIISFFPNHVIIGDVTYNKIE